MNKAQIFALIVMAGVLVHKYTGFPGFVSAGNNEEVVAEQKTTGMYNITESSITNSNSDIGKRKEDALKLAMFWYAGADQIERDGKQLAPVITSTSQLKNWIDEAMSILLRFGEVSQKYPSLTDQVSVELAKAIRSTDDPEELKDSEIVSKDLTAEMRAKIVDVLNYAGNICLKAAK